MRHPVSQTKPQQIRQCRECGCVEDDCAACIERTGKPCHWIEVDLCSACGWGLAPIEELRLPRLMKDALCDTGIQTAGDLCLFWSEVVSSTKPKSRCIERGLLAAAIAIERLAQASRPARPEILSTRPLPFMEEVPA